MRRIIRKELTKDIQKYLARKQRKSRPRMLLKVYGKKPERQNPFKLFSINDPTQGQKHRWHWEDRPW